MNNALRITSVLLLSVAGCVMPASKLGEGADSTSTSPSEDTEDSATTTVGASMTGPSEPNSGAIGEPCDHGQAPGYVPESRLLTFPALDCEGLLCVYGDSDEPPTDPCTSDDECNGPNGSLMRFTCNVPEARCELSATYFHERSMCSETCEIDADCATDAITSCQSGFRCVPMTSIGDVCCQPVCVCNDDLDEGSVQNLITSCEAGTQEGCCDVSPGNGLCPD